MRFNLTDIHFTARKPYYNQLIDDNACLQTLKVREVEPLLNLEGIFNESPLRKNINILGITRRADHKLLIVLLVVLISLIYDSVTHHDLIINIDLSIDGLYYHQHQWLLHGNTLDSS